MKEFIEFERDLPDAVRKMPAAMSIYFFICTKSKKSGALITSRSLLADYFDISISTVKRATALLKREGLISVWQCGGLCIYFLPSAAVDEINDGIGGKQKEYRSLTAVALFEGSEWEDGIN